MNVMVCTIRSCSNSRRLTVVMVVERVINNRSRRVKGHLGDERLGKGSE